MKYLYFVAVLVVLTGGGILLLATRGDDGESSIARSVVTEGSRGSSQVAQTSNRLDGSGSPTAPSEPGDSAARGRAAVPPESATGENGEPSAPDRAAGPVSVENEDDIERSALAAPQEDDTIERTSLAANTGGTEEQTSPDTKLAANAERAEEKTSPDTKIAANAEGTDGQTSPDTGLAANTEGTGVQMSPNTGLAANTEGTDETTSPNTGLAANTEGTDETTSPDARLAVNAEGTDEPISPNTGLAADTERTEGQASPGPGTVVTPTSDAEVEMATDAKQAPARRESATPAASEEPDQSPQPTEPAGESKVQVVENGSGPPQVTVEPRESAEAGTRRTEAQALGSDEDRTSAQAEARSEGSSETEISPIEKPTEPRQVLVASAGSTDEETSSVGEKTPERPQVVAERRPPLSAERQEQTPVEAGRVSVRTIKSRRVGAPTGSVVAETRPPGTRSVEARRQKLAEGGTDRQEVAALRPGSTVQRSPNDSGGIAPTFDVVRISANGNAVVAGRAEPGSDVVVLDRGTALGQAKANGRGEWVLVPLKPLPPGATELYVEASLPGASSLRRSADVVILSVPARDATVAKPARSLAVLTPRGGGATRVLQGSRPPVSRDKGGPGISLDVVDYDEVGNIVLSGRADPDAEIRTYADNRLVGTSRSDANGDWQLSPDVQIAPGDHELRVDSISSDGTVQARAILPFSRANPDGFDLRDGRVVVQPGNSLWRIARATYGAGIRYTLIFEANRDQIGDPHLIFPGQVFSVPEPN